VLGLKHEIVFPAIDQDILPWIAPPNKVKAELSATNARGKVTLQLTAPQQRSAIHAKGQVILQKTVQKVKGVLVVGDGAILLEIALNREKTTEHATFVQELVI